MSEHSLFMSKAKDKSADEVHRKKLLKVIATYDNQVVAQKSSQFHSWEEGRSLGAEVKDYVLSHLPDLLEEFERNISARGAKVLWAKDYEEAQRYLVDIFNRHSVKRVVKSKSMTTEEIHFNEYFGERGYDVVETDLGELIVQLAGEKPYHIVTPCMHKSKAEISDLFHDKLGTPQTESAEELAGAARVHLREKYVTADLGITGANFLLAKEGAALVLENEGNGRLSMGCPPVHVVLAGIEKVLPSIRDLELFLPLLATSGTGQQITAYNSVVRGPKASGELDGPEHLYVILLDNGRSDIYKKEEVRESLRCIRCGACLNACPVYKAVGGHTYHTAYPGPIGAVITPHLKGIKEWNHLSFASTLCGACTDVCPVKIPLHHMLLHNRKEAIERGAVSPLWRGLMASWSFVYAAPRILEFSGKIGRAAIGASQAVFGKPIMPTPPKIPFRNWWRDSHGK